MTKYGNDSTELIISSIPFVAHIVRFVRVYRFVLSVCINFFFALIRMYIVEFVLFVTVIFYFAL